MASLQDSNKTSKARSVAIIVVALLLAGFAINHYLSVNANINFGGTKTSPDVSRLDPSQENQEPELKREKTQEDNSNAPEFLTEELRAELDWVADAYAEQSKYPPYSRVISDPELAKAPEPFEEALVEFPTLDEDGQPLPLRLAASVDKIRYLKGEVIIAQLTASGLPENAQFFASSNIRSADGNLLLPVDIPMTAHTQSSFEFRAQIPTNAFSLQNGSHELLLRISIKIDEQSMVTTVPFFFSSASAQLDNVALSVQHQDFLNIPLEYTVFETGYYFVQAFLDDADSGRPLLALQAEGQLNEGNARLILKAHHQALKDAGSEGPYILRIARSFRGARPGEGNDVPTAISKPAYEIPAFAFAGYADIPYSDPEVEERLEALRSLGNRGG